MIRHMLPEKVSNELYSAQTRHHAIVGRLSKMRQGDVKGKIQREWDAYSKQIDKILSRAGE